METTQAYVKRRCYMSIVCSSTLGYGLKSQISGALSSCDGTRLDQDNPSLQFSQTWAIYVSITITIGPSISPFCHWPLISPIHTRSYRLHHFWKRCYHEGASF